MYVSHSAPHGKLDVLDHGRVPFTASLRVVRRAEGLLAPKVSKPARTREAAVTMVSVVTAQPGATNSHRPAVRLRRPRIRVHSRLQRAMLAGQVVGAGADQQAWRSAAGHPRQRAAHDFDIRRQGWTRGRPAGAKMPLQTHRGIQGRGDGPVEQESRGNLGNTISQVRADIAGLSRI